MNDNALSLYYTGQPGGLYPNQGPVNPADLAALAPQAVGVAALPPDAGALHIGFQAPPLPTSTPTFTAADFTGARPATGGISPEDADRALAALQAPASNRPPQILNGAAAATAAPAVTTSTLADRLGIAPGHFTGGEVAQNLNINSLLDGSFTGADLRRYKKHGGGQVQDAAPENVADRVATLAQLDRDARLGIEKQTQGVAQGHLDLDRQKQDLDRQKQTYLMSPQGRIDAIMQTRLAQSDMSGGEIQEMLDNLEGTIGRRPVPTVGGTPAAGQAGGSTTNMDLPPKVKKADPPVWAPIEATLDKYIKNPTGQYDGKGKPLMERKLQGGFLMDLDAAQPGFTRQNFPAIAAYMINRYGSDAMNKWFAERNDRRLFSEPTSDELARSAIVNLAKEKGVQIGYTRPGPVGLLQRRGFLPTE